MFKLWFPIVAAGIYVGCHGSVVHAKSSRLELILRTKALNVCIWPDYYSITFRNVKTQRLSGIDIDLSGELAKDLGVKLTYVDSSFPELVNNLAHGKCDIAMHAVGITPARREKLAFTQPYLRSDIYAITTVYNKLVRRWEDLDQPGRVLAVQAGTYMESVMQETVRHAKVLVIRPPMTREAEVEAGRADAFMADFPYSQRVLAMTDWAWLVSPPAPFYLTDYAYALAPDDSSLLDRVNRFIDTIKRDGRLAHYARKHKLDPILITGSHDAGRPAP